MRDYADLLIRWETVLIPAYARKTGKSAQEITAMCWRMKPGWMGKNALSTVLLMNCCHPSDQWRELNRKRTGDFLHMPETIKGMITTRHRERQILLVMNRSASME